ncbi:MAG: YybH family protein [Solirubrobacteraceae bacterium]
MADDVVGLEEVARRLFELLDALDISGIGAFMTEDAQAVDELTRSWMRGRVALEEHFSHLPDMVADVRSTVSDLSATAWGDVGLVTLLLDQTYTADGAVQQITAPTSLIFRRQAGEWKLALVHSVPLGDVSG